MENEATQLLFELLKSVVYGKALSDEFKKKLTQEAMQSLYRLSTRHDLAHLVGVVLEQNGLLSKSDQLDGYFRKQYMMAVYRYENMDHAFKQLCDALRSAQIPFIPLKGAVLRTYYPEPWMRTSCDIDVLIKQVDLERAIEQLVHRASFIFKERDPHDVSLFSQNGVHIELHFHLIEEVRYPIAVQTLSKAWDYASPSGDDPYLYELSDDFFYFYHVAHTAKHFENGGCGIRPLLDLWYLEHRVSHDRAKRDAMLEKGNLLTFANAARELCAVWFDGKSPSPVTLQMQEYILTGGVYGNLDNSVAVRQTKQGSVRKSIRSRLFLPYEMLSEKHPILKKHRWLSPIFQIRRWIVTVRRGKIKQTLCELELHQSIPRERVDSVGALLRKIGL